VSERALARAGPALPAVPRGAGLGPIVAVAWAGVLDRTRRPAFALGLVFMLWLGQHMLPPAGSAYRTFVMDDEFRPLYNAAWVGTLTAILTGLWFLFVGFYQAKGSVERDRRTGVGQLLAASRMSTLAYVSARTLGNLIAFAIQAAAVALAALIQQQLLAEDRRVDLAATLLPFLAITGPLALFASAAAVFFDCMSWLKGGLGNFVWFFLLGFLLSTSGMQDPKTSASRDLIGARAVVNDLRATLAAQHPETASHPPEFSMGVNMSPRANAHPVKTFHWEGTRWTAGALASRLPFVLGSVLVVLAAAVLFDRFDATSRVRAERGRRGARATTTEAHLPAVPVGQLTVARRGAAFAGVVRAELALMLRAPSMWWWLGVLGLWIAEFATPLSALRTVVLPLASIWPALLWSQLGQRERRHDTGPLLFSCPRPLARLLPGAWAAGAIVGLLVGAPALLRFAFSLGAEGSSGALAGWLSCAAFVPAAALALGVWTGGSKAFEVLYLFAWYVGPMHHVAELDYTGVTTARSPVLWVVYLALTVVAYALASAMRMRQLRS